MSTGVAEKVDAPVAPSNYEVQHNILPEELDHTGKRFLGCSSREVWSSCLHRWKIIGYSNIQNTDFQTCIHLKCFPLSIWNLYLCTTSSEADRFWLENYYLLQLLLWYTFLSSYNLLIHGKGPGSAQCTKRILMHMISCIVSCVFDPNKYTYIHSTCTVEFYFVTT